MEAAGFPEWLDHTQCDTLVIGGCTTTACVRVSSQAVAQAYVGKVRVVVDLSLCGARADNYDPELARIDPQLRRIYGEDVIGRSAVDLAILQMQRGGVHVVDTYDWSI